MYLQEQSKNTMITALNIIIERGIVTKEQLPEYAHWYVGIQGDGKKIECNGE